MGSANAGAFAVVLILFGILQSGESLRCYQCVSRVRRGDRDACLNGDFARLGQVHCLVPSKCIFFQVYNYTSDIYYVTRGCQDTKYETCIGKSNELRLWGDWNDWNDWNDLRDSSLWEDGILKNLSTCVMCGTDLCNTFKNGISFSSSTIKTIHLVIPMIYALAWLYI